MCDWASSFDSVLGTKQWEVGIHRLGLAGVVIGSVIAGSLVTQGCNSPARFASVCLYNVCCMHVQFIMYAVCTWICTLIGFSSGGRLFYKVM